MIDLKEKLKQVVNRFKKEPIALTEGFKRLEQVKRAASMTGKAVQDEKERLIRRSE